MLPKILSHVQVENNGKTNGLSLEEYARAIVPAALIDMKKPKDTPLLELLFDHPAQFMKLYHELPKQEPLFKAMFAVLEALTRVIPPGQNSEDDTERRWFILLHREGDYVYVRKHETASSSMIPPASLDMMWVRHTWIDIFEYKLFPKDIEYYRDLYIKDHGVPKGQGIEGYVRWFMARVLLPKGDKT